jgi:hypothetical protein
MHIAVGTSLAVIVSIAAVGALIHHTHASLNLDAFLVISVGAVIGAVIGASLAHAIPAELLMRVFGVVLLFVSIRMILGH